ncbi:MAG: 1,2-phenylacetyl-CoA epoxidase subunit PaaD [Bacteroidota bacterium]
MVEVATTHPTWEDARAVLETIVDPEIPVVSLLELRVIRNLSVEGNRAVVEMTPTFLGCPALDYMKREIREKLLAKGFDEVTIDVKLSPLWTTDLLTEEVREKLRAFGIAPPEQRGQNLLDTLNKPVACPFCHSYETRLTSPFGPTLCRQIFYCDQCKQSFERFKPL